MDELYRLFAGLQGLDEGGIWSVRLGAKERGASVMHQEIECPESEWCDAWILGLIHLKARRYRDRVTEILEASFWAEPAAHGKAAIEGKQLYQEEW